MNFNFPILKSKNSFYVYSSIFFVVWISFFDEANLVKQFSLWLKLQDCNEQLEYFDDELANVKQQEELLLSDMDALEKYGREKYLMKKEGETVFVIVDKDGEWLEE